jgi:arginine/lysine/ornithine decarboxylase
LLLVDNAHGAYLKFVKDGAHPVDLGADLVCDSAHKTLPCLTGSAYLHVGKTAPDFFKDNAENALSLYASTSPSYLILQSLDNFNKVIADTPSYFDNTARLVEELKAKLASLNYDVVGNEPLKITLSTKGYGYLGGEVASHLQEAGIVVEFSDADYVTMMFSPCNTPLDFERTERALTALAPKKSILTSPPHAPVLKQGLPAKDAIFAPSETVAVKDSLGRILSSPTVSCPPAIPVAVCGEVIDEDAVKCFEYYNVNTILVVKE